MISTGQRYRCIHLIDRYSIEILDKELVSGVSNEVPLIEGYSEELVTLEAGINLFQFLRLIAGLGTNPADSVAYRFSAKIDFNGLQPLVLIEHNFFIAL